MNLSFNLIQNASNPICPLVVKDNNHPSNILGIALVALPLTAGAIYFSRRYLKIFFCGISPPSDSIENIKATQKAIEDIKRQQSVDDYKKTLKYYAATWHECEAIGKKYAIVIIKSSKNQYFVRLPRDYYHSRCPRLTICTEGNLKGSLMLNDEEYSECYLPGKPLLDVLTRIRHRLYGRYHKTEESNVTKVLMNDIYVPKSAVGKLSIKKNLF